MFDDITEYFEHLLSHAPTIGEAQAEFIRAVADDSELREQYRNWCHENGTTEKRGFAEFSEEFLQGRNEVWDTLTDYDNVQ